MEVPRFLADCSRRQRRSSRVQQRGLDRDHHAGFERPLRIKGIVRHWAGIGEPRRLVAHEPHAVGEKLVVIVQLRLLQNRLGRGIDLAPFTPTRIDLKAACWVASISASRSSSSASGSPAMPMRARSPI